MLSIEGLTVRYPASRRGGGGDVNAVTALDLEVADGEVVALLGPSGCGKTTLLRAVAGLVDPTDGRVVLDGVDLTRVPTHQRGIGLMFQDYALFPHRDVGGNVGFGLRMRGDPAPERDRRVAEVLDLVGLAGYRDRAVSTLSGGERQRVALARALAPAPGLLMLDEPLGALDRTLRDELVVELSSLFAELGITVVYVTHDQSEALALAARVVIMQGGRIAQQGTPREVWEHPGSPFIARFLGFTNLVEVEVRGGRVHGPWGELALSSEADRAALLLVRPEGVRPSAPDEPGARAALVRGVVFRGDHSIVRLELTDGTVLDAALPAERVAPEPLDVGAAIHVVIDPRHTQVLPGLT